MAALQDVDDIACSLRAIDSIDGVIIFGSHARRDHHLMSDLDLLIVRSASTPASATKEEVRKRTSTGNPRPSIIAYTADELIAEIDKRPSFGAHLSDEGIFAYCTRSCSRVRRRLKDFILDKEALSRELQYECQALDLFTDTARFNRQFVSSLGRLYSIARSVVIIKLLQSGVHEYDWRRIFDEFAGKYPERSADVDLLSSLRPFYEYLVNRRGNLPKQLKDDQVMSPGTVTASIRAVRSIASIREARQT